MIDDPPPALVGHFHPTFQGQPGDAGNGRQCLAAEAECRDLLDGIVRQFRGRMAFKCECHIGCGHAATVVGDFDPSEAAVDDRDRDPCCTGIDCILNKFFQRRGRSLDNFAGGNAIHQVFGQAAD